MPTNPFTNAGASHPMLSETQRRLISLGLNFVPVVGPALSGAYNLARLGGGIYRSLSNHTTGSDPGAPSDAPYYPDVTKFSGNYGSDPSGPTLPGSTTDATSPYTPPTRAANGAATPGGVNPHFGGLNPGQAASDAQTAYQTGIQQLQSQEQSPFYQQDELHTPDGPPVSRVSPYSGGANIHARDAYMKLLASNGGYSSIPSIQSMNSAISSGALPTWQQYIGAPAYTGQPTAPGTGYTPRDLTPPAAAAQTPQAAIAARIAQSLKGYAASRGG